MTNDIKARILAGEDPDKVMKEYTDALNDALVEKSKREDEAKQSKVKEEHLNAYADNIAANLAAYIKEAAPNAAKYLDEAKVDGSAMREILDDGLPYLDALAAIANEDNHITPIKVKAKRVKEDPEAIFAKFLKDAGLV